jgi:hypothetical protein
MTGRRIKTMDPGVYRPVQNPEYPVVIEGHWANVPYDEQVKQIEVEELKVISRTWSLLVCQLNFTKF